MHFRETPWRKPWGFLVAIHTPIRPLPKDGYTYPMKFLRGIVGWGITIYAVMYLFWSGTVIYGFSLGILPLILRLAVLFFMTAIATRSLRLMNWKDLLPFAGGWTLIAILLDAVFLVPFAGWGLYASWSVWIGYFLIIVFPMIALVFARRRMAGANMRVS